MPIPEYRVEMMKFRVASVILDGRLVAFPVGGARALLRVERGEAAIAGCYGEECIMYSCVAVSELVVASVSRAAPVAPVLAEAQPSPVRRSCRINDGRGWHSVLGITFFGVARPCVGYFASVSVSRNVAPRFTGLGRHILISDFACVQ